MSENQLQPQSPAPAGEFHDVSDLVNLLKENRLLLEKIYKTSEKTRRYMLWNIIGMYLKIVIIVVPMIIGAFYVWPLLKQALGALNQLGGMENILKSYMEILK